MRPIHGPDELEQYCRLPYRFNEELADDLVQNRRRPEWLWMALDRDRLLARVGWWSRDAANGPGILDILDVDDGDDGLDRVGLMTRLLDAASEAVIPPGTDRPYYSRFAAPDWRDRVDEHRAVSERMASLERSGYRLLVERLQYNWPVGTPVSEPSGRLAFHPVASADELIDLMVRVLDGTLDAHDRESMTRASPRQVAEDHFDQELAVYSSPREWWKVATLPDGQAVGFVIPAHNGYNPIIAYIAVLPEHRGQGYIDEILAEGTRVLAAEGVDRIRASTDLSNRPMARAFERAGWVNFSRSVDMTWSPTGDA
jgi:GNAT superfamily N-acetyltransferase